MDGSDLTIATILHRSIRIKPFPGLRTAAFGAEV